MNKLFFGLVLAAVYPTISAATDLPGNDTETSMETVQVKDYQSFFVYVAREEAKLAKPRVSNDTGVIRRVLKEKGFAISSSTVWAQNSDQSKIAHQSPNNIGVSITDYKTHHVEIYNVNGEKLREIPLSRGIKGWVAYSDAELFFFRGGGRVV